MPYKHILSEVLMFYGIKPFIPVMQTIFSMQVPRGTIAIAISLLGAHMVNGIIKFFVKRKAGLGLQEISKMGHVSPHFSLKEFACKCGSGFTAVAIHKQMKRFLWTF